MLTLVLGYCGSGKTPLLNELEKRGVKKFDECFVNDSAKHARLLAALRNGQDCAVGEIAYCVEDERNKFIAEVAKEAPGTVIVFEAFEADLGTANENCRRRTNKGAAEAHVRINTDRIGSRYKIPDGVVARKIQPIA